MALQSFLLRDCVIDAPTQPDKTGQEDEELQQVGRLVKLLLL